MSGWLWRRLWLCCSPAVWPSPGWATAMTSGLRRALPGRPRRPVVRSRRRRLRERSLGPGVGRAAPPRRLPLRRSRRLRRRMRWPRLRARRARQAGVVRARRGTLRRRRLRPPRGRLGRVPRRTGHRTRRRRVAGRRTALATRRAPGPQAAGRAAGPLGTGRAARALRRNRARARRRRRSPSWRHPCRWGKGRRAGSWGWRSPTPPPRRTSPWGPTRWSATIRLRRGRASTSAGRLCIPRRRSPSSLDNSATATARPPNG